MIKLEHLSVSLGKTEVVKNVNVEINDGHILGIVGESGSGKSVMSLSIMGLLPTTANVSGTIEIDKEVSNIKDSSHLKKGVQMAMVFQEPMTSLNPTMKIGSQVEEMLKLHTDLDKLARKAKVLESLKSVGLKEPEKVYTSYPHELSGGMRQRVMIAIAVILEPKLIIADEPTTALDVTVQNQIIKLLSDINKKKNNSMIFITHDLNLARKLCTDIAVMKNGVVVEKGTTQDIFSSPKHEYTKMLLEKVPSRIKGVSDNDILENSDNSHKQDVILEVNNLDVYYKERNAGRIFSSKKKVHVVKDVSFDIRRGEILGLVGESGCGKTTLSKAILGINTDYKGSIVNNAGKISMIFQDPYSSLNPSKTIGWLLQEPLRAMLKKDKNISMTKEDIRTSAYDMLKKVELDEKYFDRKPSQLSGGQRQRISIGQALITKPALVIADEPVSALDVTIQAQIMELMIKLQQEMSLSYLFISHDINVIYKMSNRLMIMKDGKILEKGNTQEVFDNPVNEYTKMLLE